MDILRIDDFNLLFINPLVAVSTLLLCGLEDIIYRRGGVIAFSLFIVILLRVGEKFLSASGNEVAND